MRHTADWRLCVNAWLAFRPMLYPPIVAIMPANQKNFAFAVTGRLPGVAP
jgi:hypothetical protein